MYWGKPEQTVMLTNLLVAGSFGSFIAFKILSLRWVFVFLVWAFFLSYSKFIQDLVKVVGRYFLNEIVWSQAI